jgi:predicted anti-sigma-YlaC factor YlaD
MRYSETNMKTGPGDNGAANPATFPGRMKTAWLLVLLVVITGSWSCSIKKMAMKQVANALTAPGGGEVFTGDNDPELVGDALPFAIKMYESLMESAPYHMGLKLRTGSMYIMYANGFLDTPATMMTDEKFREKEFLEKRAKNLYLRGRDILLHALEYKYPTFKLSLKKKEFVKALQTIGKKDIEVLYWAGAGWMGAFAIDPFDMKMGMTLPKAAAIMERVLQLEPGYGDGAINDFYVLYYGSLPEYMGGNLDKAREHFEKAVEASGGKSGSPYLSLATTVLVQQQKKDEFVKLLKTVLDIDVDADPANRLVNILNQRKARWLIEHVGDFFLIDESDNSNGEENVN